MSHLLYSMVNSPLPCVTDRSSDANPNISFKGASTVSWNQPSEPSEAWMMPLRLLI